jgi:hypothetical protein
MDNNHGEGDIVKAILFHVCMIGIIKMIGMTVEMGGIALERLGLIPDDSVKKDNNLAHLTQQQQSERTENLAAQAEPAPLVSCQEMDHDIQ